MIPKRLTKLIEEKGVLETQPADQVFHAQNFSETLFMLKSGYVKRYQVSNNEKRVIELIYGPGHIFPLSQLYKQLFNAEMNRENLIYVYQTMTDIEIMRISDQDIISELQKDPQLFEDLFYEAGLRLKSNIDRLASNALKDDYKKVTHQFVCLAEEFGELTEHKGEQAIKIQVPLRPIDMAEQLNISVEVTEAVMNSLQSNGLLIFDGEYILIADMALLKDAYL